MAKLTPAPGALFDAGNFRLYDNRIEINKYGLLGGLKGFDVIYYSDIASIKAGKKELQINRNNLKGRVTLEFKKKEQTQAALAIINGNKA
ncbi:hypothetical protein [Bifidobacterium biavatii]|uniref:Uncharacterized protein n=1 Tax=Bifidobacterium biavatii DSM 23969 TaxID=1437608 RepID=A0A086ZTS1_9BIFI|nr:hypothetical protein [Bifidobacterium biavatii]KFI49921.1 hypothetical protein BBIA_1843 [Bifidobacterium biavatii DSM 23969]